MLSIGKKTGKLSLKNIDREGEVILKDGRPIHATVSDAQGLEALYSFFLWTEGSFTFEANIASPAETIELSTDAILREAGERKRVWEEVKSKLPDMNVILEPVEDIKEKEITLSQEDWKILILAFRRNTVKSILSLSKLGGLDSIYTTLSLMDRGVLKVGEVTTRDPSREVIVELRHEGLISTTPTGEVAFIDTQLIQEWQKEGWLTSGVLRLELITPSKKNTIIPIKGRVGLKEGVIQLPATVLSRLGIKPGDKIKAKPES